MLTILLISLVSGIAIIIPAMDIIIDKHGTGIRKLRFGGLLLIAAVILLVILPVIQYKNQQDDELKKSKDLKNSYDSSLREIKKKFDTTNLNTVSVIADNLGKYGYKFDSANNRLIKVIRDSSKTKIVIGNDPVVKIYKLYIEPLSDSSKGFFHIKLSQSIESADAGSCCFDLKLSYVGETDKNDMVYLTNSTALNQKDKLSKDESKTSYMYIGYELNLKMIYVWVRGKYKTIDQSKSFDIDNVYYINVKTNTFGSIMGLTREKVTFEVSSNEK